VNVRTEKHVLYVDDERALVALSIRGLKQFGYRVTGFSDAHEALASFKAEPDAYDAVITDLSMPQLSGLSLVHAMKAVRSGFPVIATSGHVTDEEREQCDAYGVNELLAKPFTLDHLANALNRLFT
jgi:two-component system cell cycle sensor histidine kinase/response regulator CckA